MIINQMFLLAIYSIFHFPLEMYSRISTTLPTFDLDSSRRSGGELRSLVRAEDDIVGVYH